MLDIFRNDAFSLTSLTDAILKSPYKPGRLQAMGLFGEKSIATTNIVVEEKDGRLELIQTSPRGGPGSQLGTAKRRARSFLANHIEKDSTIYADEVQGVRAFGSESATETIQGLVNERLEELRQFIEATIEWHRVGALKGLVLDADSSTLLDIYAAFGVSQQVYAMSIDTGAEEVRRQCIEIQRLIEDEMGAEPISSYRAFCGDAFFDALLESDSIKETLKYQEGARLREDLRKGFLFGGITFENYRGSVGATSFFDDDEAYVIPEGTSIFKTYFAPADFNETVNTFGKRMYAKTFTDPELQRWTKVHSQSNLLALNLRPRAVVKLTLTT